MRPARAPSIVPAAVPEPTAPLRPSPPALAAHADAVRLVAAQMQGALERGVSGALPGLARARQENERRS